MVPETSEERIEVRTADAEQALILAVDQGAPLLSITRVSRDAAGRPVEFSHDLFRADRLVITVRGARSAVSSDPSDQRP